MEGDDVHAEALKAATQIGRAVVPGLKGCRYLWNKSVGVSFFPPLLFKHQLTDGAEGEKTQGFITPCVALGLLFLT